MVRPPRGVFAPWRRLAPAGALVAVVLAACGSGGGSGTATPRPTGQAGQAGLHLGPPQITVTPANGAGDVRLDAAVKVEVAKGRVRSVTVHPEGSPATVPGTTSPDGATWSSTDPLDPNVTYVIDATAQGPAGDDATTRSTFHTMDRPARLTTAMQPDDGATVGVGMPITLRFNAPVATDRQANLVQHIQVQTSVPVTGAWHWFSPSEVHWRPQTYWASGTHVTVVANLRGVDAGGGVWGLGDWSSAFTIGEKHVSTINAATHQMQVTRNDQPVYQWPVSTGRPDRPTISGTLVVWYKQYDVLMDSLSIGIPRNSPDGYYEHVYWDTAISTDGFFVHAAPWSVWAQGTQNVSHGCVNLSTERAQTFYNFSQPGDVVIVTGTSRAADASDGEGDWQIPFAQYANSGGQVTPAPAPATPGGI